MAKRAQAEFVVIVGIVLLALVTIYYATQSGIFVPSNVSPGVFEKQKAVQESLLSMARKGADNALKVMETHGGYPTAELLGNGTYTIPPFAVFMDEGIPYWTRCQNNLTPSKEDVTRWFKLSMEHYIQTHISEITDTYKNATFDLSKLSVSVNILTDPRKIEITVNLPTKVDGYAMSSQLYPYKISLDSKLGEIYDFARDFSKAQSSKRFLEVFTTASVYMSADAADGQPKLPTGGFLTDCGETIYRTPNQISLYLKEIAEYVLTQTLWWQKMPVDPSKPKVYAINTEIMDNEYRDLEIGMYLPDDFQFSTQGSVVITNNKRAYTSMFWTSSKCLGVYSMSYAISYPIIVRVKDPLSGYSFNFAAFVFVDNSGGKMQPGKCEDIHETKDPCREADRDVTINVTDETGKPIEGAIATFGECGIGVSNASGIIKGKIKCDKGCKINIYKNSSYGYYSQNVSSSSVNATYVLPCISNVTAQFQKVTITQQGPITKCVIGKATDYAFLDFVSGDNLFIITNIDPDSISENCIDKACLDQCQASLSIDACTRCASGCMGGVLDVVNANYVPAGNYDTNATMMNLNIMKETGGFITPYTVKSSTKSIYIQIPETTPGYQISQSKKFSLTQDLRECQIEPISETSYPKTTIVTSCTCENLKTVWEDLKASCANAASLDCTTCCNLDQLKQSLSDCDTRVICK